MPSTPAKKRVVPLTCGEHSKHGSCKKRFEKPLSHEEQGYYIKPRRNAGRKPKGKKPARTTIRKLFTIL
ncbi:MAG: hypothetical protein KBC41_00160 [Candidatus Pacebacteria bacterium]|nr:hypothetical protein [Candidatus Paceibacterota bacterium]MBP9866480.1 hypothetical protein [Candidatus Paceibacterota bacterium]